MLCVYHQQWWGKLEEVCYLFIADITRITKIEKQENFTLIPSAHVCIEIGYAIESKLAE